MILALDLSTACSGWAKFDEMGNLLSYGRISPEDKLNHFLKIKFVVNELAGHMLEADNLVVEGIFLNTFTGGFHNVTGFELLARLSGAVINSYLQNHDIIPTVYKATEGRKLVGVKATSQKAEIQLWVIRKFQVGNIVKAEDSEAIDLDDFDSLIDAAYAELNTKQIKRPAFKARMDKISRMIEEATGIGEDVADAVLLGKAFCNAKNRPMDNTESK